MGGFRSLFKRKKEEVVDDKKAEVTIPEKAVGTTARPSRAVDAPINGAITSHSKPPPKTEPAVVESRPPVPEVAIVKGTSKAERASWFSRTHYFKEMSNWAFDVVDLDGSGFVDEKELYSGLLLIHLKLGSYAGPAACRPVARERVHDLFVKRDRDNSGTLDREEFGQVIAVLCGNVFTRVFAQWSLTLIIVPMVAKILLDGFVSLATFGWDALTNLEGYDVIEAAILTQYNHIGTWLYDKSPAFLMDAGSMFVSRMYGILDMIPDSVWSTVPVTLVSCILGCLAVPYIIFKIDDFFQAMGERKATKRKTAGS